MNKQEVISKLKSAITKNNVDDYQKGETAGLNFALLLLAELDESEKPVLPQFVAGLGSMQKRWKNETKNARKATKTPQKNKWRNAKRVCRKFRQTL